MPRERGAYSGNALVYPMGIMGKRNEMPVGQAFFFSKCPALSQGEIPLDKVPSRYTRNFLLVNYGCHKAPTHAQGNAHSKRPKWYVTGYSQGSTPPCGPLLQCSAEVERESLEGVKGGHHVYLKLSISHL